MADEFEVFSGLFQQASPEAEPASDEAKPKRSRRAVGVWGRKAPSSAALRVKAARELAAAREQEDVLIRRASRFMPAREVRFLEASQSGAGGAPLPLGLCREPVAMLMSYGGATTLEQALRVDRWSEAKAVNVAVRLCRRVEEIHAKGLIHNDLKADNVMLDKALDVSVIDFGSATPEGGVVGYENDGSFRAEWLAPELLSGGTSTRASDAFSVGFLLRQICHAMKRPSKKARASGGAQEKFASAIEGAQRPEPGRRLTLGEIEALLKPPTKGAASQ
ncbi:serine/threonine/tyrosine-protein kinase HT1-like [Penaeus chinensis]|uniref:serine/threonine/tyrosine-protein kinase HT1-like n=1 Tax=Penaeus chinensis TaxID=139456 RepID=UPI001FB6CF0D|nr:serine/threonine/tyrosine-protein kinase HT1-like [Penaeus chinensis]